MIQDCILWVGPKNGDGYGRVQLHDRQAMAHRHVYEVVYGEIPEGHQVHHMCEVRDCLNPLHLSALLPKEHKREHRKTLCRYGHALDKESRGKRYCSTCKRLRRRADRRGLGDWKVLLGATA